jgi:hypothetical protein
MWPLQEGSKKEMLDTLKKYKNTLQRYQNQPTTIKYLTRTRSCYYGMVKNRLKLSACTFQSNINTFLLVTI